MPSKTPRKTTAVLTVLLGLLLAAQTLKAEEFPYRGYDEALQEAGRENKLVMVFFWADWCGFCNQIRREVFSSPDIHSAFAKNFIAVSVNVEKDDQDLMKKYGVRALPTLAFLSPDGEILGFQRGAVDRETFLKMLAYLADKAGS